MICWFSHKPQSSGCFLCGEAWKLLDICTRKCFRWQKFLCLWLWLVFPKQDGRDGGFMHAGDMICGQYLSIFNLLDRSLVVLACIVPAIRGPFCFKTCWDQTIQTAFDQSWDKQFNVWKGWLLISSGANNPEEFNDENLVEIHVQTERTFLSNPDNICEGWLL